jgi:hypothetical protein
MRVAALSLFFFEKKREEKVGAPQVRPAAA